MTRADRVAGALVGSVVGDALGAPFEFGPEGQFTERHGDPRDAEMIAGGPWEVGEWTDDTQMALIVAEGLLRSGRLDLPALFEEFQRWAFAKPKDIGFQTNAVLTGGHPYDRAARTYFERGRPAAGNGSLMRTTPAAIFYASTGRIETMHRARRLSALTHGDPGAGEGCAVYHELIRLAIDGSDPLGAIDDLVSGIEPDLRGPWREVLSPDWYPQRYAGPNGAVWPTLGAAVWALRAGWSFETAMAKVIDLGGDTDTLACVAGGLLGATQGLGAVPERWRRPLHGELIGRGRSAYDADALIALGSALDRRTPGAV